MKSFDLAIGVGNKLLDALDQASPLLHQLAEITDLDSDESNVLDAFNGVYVRVANKVEELQSQSDITSKVSGGAELKKKLLDKARYERGLDPDDDPWSEIHDSGFNAFMEKEHGMKGLANLAKAITQNDIGRKFD